jgi:hypothetical protein
LSAAGRRRLLVAPLAALLLFAVLASSAAAGKPKIKPGLPLTASPVSTLTGANAEAVKLVVRPIKRAKLGAIRISFRTAAGKLIARKRIPSPSKSPQIVSLPLKKELSAGTYRVRMIGKKKSGGGLLSAKRKIVFAAGGKGRGAKETGALVQEVTVGWSNGEPDGRDTGGFVAPGIGYGEVVCNESTQWVRFFGSAGGRETAMMTWTYKNWGTYFEKSLQEAVYTSGTGFDFNEGLNKFSPPEKTSTGSFDGVISDRGPIGAAGGGALAPVTTLSLDWEWDFTNPSKSRCQVEAVFRTETAQTTFPLARSLQIQWHGEANGNAQANGYRSIEFPGLGTVSIRCEPGEPRQIRVESAAGATITTREASEDSAISEGAGPVVANLPNNGMVVVEMAGGQRIIVASRWKLNDPDPANNSCSIAAQVASPGFPGSNLY